MVRLVDAKLSMKRSLTMSCRCILRVFGELGVRLAFDLRVDHVQPRIVGGREEEQQKEEE